MSEILDGPQRPADLDPDDDDARSFRASPVTPVLLLLLALALVIGVAFAFHEWPSSSSLQHSVQLLLPGSS